MPLKIVRGDIAQCMDVIVNAANESLLAEVNRRAATSTVPPGRNCSGCPRRWVAVRPERPANYRKFPLTCQYVVHTVGPIWRGGGHRRGGAFDLLLSKIPTTGPGARRTKRGLPADLGGRIRLSHPAGHASWPRKPSAPSLRKTTWRCIWCSTTVPASRRGGKCSERLRTYKQGGRA